MYNQTRIIKTLLLVIVTQILIFLTYYLYNKTQIKNSFLYNLPQKISKIKVRTVLPISNEFSYIKIVDNSAIQDKVVNIKKIAPKSSEDIIPIDNQKVKPILYTNSVEFSSLTIKEKKQKFIDMMVPSILVAKHQLKCDQDRVAKIIVQGYISQQDREWLIKKRKEFKALNNYELYSKMEGHPTSIIIAQAIIESGWGTSKFFQKANNIFGVWSFSKKDNRMSASKKRGKRTIYLKKYNSMEESIYDYLLTLSSGDYESFREKRLITKDPYKLVNYLIKYSEDGKKYTKSLKNMIKNNKLIVYDSYKLDI